MSKDKFKRLIVIVVSLAVILAVSGFFASQFLFKSSGIVLKNTAGQDAGESAEKVAEESESVKEPPDQTLAQTPNQPTEHQKLTRSEAQTVMRSMHDDLKPYIFAKMVNALRNGECYKIDEFVSTRFKDYEAAFASCIIGADKSNNDGIDIRYDYAAKPAGSVDALNEYCLDLFGKPFDLSVLNSWDENGVYEPVDVAVLKNEPVELVSSYSKDYIFEEFDEEVLAEDDNFKLVSNCYFGEDIENRVDSNFRIEITFKESEASKTGLAVSKLKFIRTSDDEKKPEKQEPDEDSGTDTYGTDTNGTENGAVTEPKESPFWGLWVYADSDENVAKQVATVLSGYGIDARVYLSTDWTNLNPEPLYMVTAGVYKSESEANVMLDMAKQAGYSDVFVKFTGEHI